MAKAKAKSDWIKTALGKPGTLHKQLGIPMGKKIPTVVLEKASHEAGVLGQRARLVLELNSFHKKK